jgi:beta-glucosidase
MKPEAKKAFFLIFGFFLLAQTAKSDVKFPDGFQWCVSTAAHQIEGYNVNSDWWDWEQIPGHIANGDKSGAACDSWNRVSDDVAMLEHLGVQTYRFSVEWAKIEPEEGRFDQSAIDHYRDEVDQLRAAGISPMITLQHFTFPRWVREKGAWEWDGFSDAFSNFATIVYTEIAPKSRDWVTINEPMVTILGGYLEGQTPPGETRNIADIFPVLSGLLKAHAAAYATLHQLAGLYGADIRVGLAHHLRTFDPLIRLNPLDDVATHIAEIEWNWMLPDAIESGTLKMKIPFLANKEEKIPGLAGTEDFFGVNYYTGDLIAFSFKKGLVQHTRKALEKNDLRWDIYPEGFYRTLTAVAKRYPGKPVIVTENGIADANDSKRSDFIKNHLSEMARAIKDGVPVEGYCHWSLMDNFEWTSGFAPRFGLYEMDYNNFNRTPRPSAELYRQIILDNGF